LGLFSGFVPSIMRSKSGRGWRLFVVGGRAGVQTLHLTAQNVPANFHLSGGFWVRLKYCAQAGPRRAFFR
jgi:hypothetical protein